MPGSKALNEDDVCGLPDNGRVVMVNLAHYPSRAAFLEMATPADYEAINVQRENGVEEHLILAANRAYSKLAAGSGPKIKGWSSFQCGAQQVLRCGVGRACTVNCPRKKGFDCDFVKIRKAVTAS